MRSPFLPVLLCLAVLLGLPPAMAAPKKVTTTQAATAPEEEVLWDWWFVYGAGVSPSREVIYVDSLSVEEVIDHSAIMNTDTDKRLKRFPVGYIQADAMSVAENPEKPAKTYGRVRVKCVPEKARQIMFDVSYQQYWDADRFVTVPASPWINVGNDLRFSQIAKFLCEPKARNGKNMMIRADQTSDPLNTTWAAIWKDVPKPEYTSKKTREQLDAEYNAIMAKTKGQIADATKAFTEKREQIVRDEKKFAMEQRILFDKMRSQASPLMQSWLGANERTLVANWGMPSSSYNAPDARFISYSYGYATEMVNGFGAVQANSRREYFCNMTFELHDDIIADYRSDGNDCRSVASSKPRGPN
jgi:hypothetical protein